MHDDHGVGGSFRRVPHGDDYDAPGYLERAWRHKWLLACSTGIAIGLGLLYFVAAKRLYSSEVQLLLIKKDNRLSGPDAAGRDPTTAYGVYENTMATQISLVCSPAVLGKAIDERGLSNLPSFRGMTKKDTLAALLLGLTASQASVAGVADPNVMRLRYDGAVREDCPIVADAIVNSYQEFLKRTYQDVNEETVRLIHQARDGLHRQLVEKEAAYREFRRTSPLLPHQTTGTNDTNETRAANPHEIRLAQIETARSKLLMENAQTRALADSLRTALRNGESREALALVVARADLEPGTAGTSSEKDAETSQSLVAALAREQSLLQTYGPGHPDVIAIRKKIQLLRDFLAKGTGTFRLDVTHDDYLNAYLQSLEQRCRVGEARVAELTKLFDAENQLAKTLDGAQAQEETFRSEIARTRLMFDKTVKRLEEMDAVKDYGGIHAEVISPPQLGVLVSPKIHIVLGLACIMGMTIGSGLGYVRDLKNAQSRSPKAVRGEKPVGVAVGSIQGAIAAGYDS
jgi:uncharacterized protein involved in exopolysaccharide biosynthesis